MSEKKTLEEKVGKLTLAANAWVEPMRQWLKQAVSLCEIAKNGSLAAKKQALLEIDGLNLFLKSKKAQPTAAPEIPPPLKNPWSVLRTATEKAARSGDLSAKSIILGRMMGLEPTAFCATNRRSNQLSYIRQIFESDNVQRPVG